MIRWNTLIPESPLPVLSIACTLERLRVGYTALRLSLSVPLPVFQASSSRRMLPDTWPVPQSRFPQLPCVSTRLMDGRVVCGGEDAAQPRRGDRQSQGFSSQPRRPAIS